MRLVRSASISIALLSLAALAACNDSVCDEIETQIGDICVPSAIAANSEAIIDVRESCGSICAQAPSCTAVILDGAIQLTMREDQCSTTVASCIATQCNHNVASCALPLLGIGDYPVIVSGNGPSAILRVRATGTSGCHLPQFPDAGTPDAGD